jgi:hypothetical protein
VLVTELTTYTIINNEHFTQQIVFGIIYKSTFGVCPLFTGIAFSSVRMHRNSAHIHVMAAHAAFNNHQNGVGTILLYHMQATKCIMCIVQEKSKHNRYRSTMRQMKVAPLSAFRAKTTITNFSLETVLNSLNSKITSNDLEVPTM